MELNQAIDIMKDAGFGFLGTINGDQPCVRPMMPYLVDDKELLLALLGRSRTIEQIKANPKVEFCFVDRRMAYCRIAGKAVVAEDMEKKEIVFNAIPMLRQYFSGAGDSNFVLVSVKIGRVEMMTPYERAPNELVL